MSLSKNAPFWHLVATMQTGEKIVLEKIELIQANTASEARAILKKKMNQADWKVRRLPVGYRMEKNMGSLGCNDWTCECGEDTCPECGRGWCQQEDETPLTPPDIHGVWQKQDGTWVIPF